MTSVDTQLQTMSRVPLSFGEPTQPRLGVRKDSVLLDMKRAGTGFKIIVIMRMPAQNDMSRVFEQRKNQQRHVDHEYLESQASSACEEDVSACQSYQH